MERETRAVLFRKYDTLTCRIHRELREQRAALERLSGMAEKFNEEESVAYSYSMGEEGVNAYSFLRGQIREKQFIIQKLEEWAEI